MAFEVDGAVMGLVGVVIGGAISGGTTWLVARADRYRFARERTWDLRREAYTDIIAQLMATDSWAKVIDTRYDDDPHTYDASQDIREHTKQFAGYYQEAKAKYTMTRLIISDQFAARFETMMHDLEGIDSNQNLLPPESAKMVYELIHTAMGELMKIGFNETVAGHS